MSLRTSYAPKLILDGAKNWFISSGPIYNEAQYWIFNRKWERVSLRAIQLETKSLCLPIRVSVLRQLAKYDRRRLAVTIAVHIIKTQGFAYAKYNKTLKHCCNALPNGSSNEAAGP